MDKIQLLVFSFYREEPQIKKLLSPLYSCTFSRNLENIHIYCLDTKHLKEINGLLTYLEPPFALLGLAKRIILRAPGGREQIFCIKERYNSDLFK